MRAAIILVAALALALGASITRGASMSIQKSEFGKTHDGQAVDLYTLTN